MGEAKRKNKDRARILEECPYCIYCGGETPSTTIDHCPPSVIFDNRQRPQGLEFAACGPCNRGGGGSELIAALLSRVFPNHNLEINEIESKKIKAMANDVEKHYPGFKKETMPTTNQSKKIRDYFGSGSGFGAIDLSGPIVNNAIHEFAAKIGYALHYKFTGKIVQKNEGACTQWFSNYQTVIGDVPDTMHKIADLMGPSRTLSQGRMNVRDQFVYKSCPIGKDGKTSIHFAIFRLSFRIDMLVGEGPEISNIRRGKGSHFHAPGFLRKFLSENN